MMRTVEENGIEFSEENGYELFMFNFFFFGDLYWRPGNRYTKYYYNIKKVL